MKKTIITLFVFMVLWATAMAQTGAPQKFNYQAVPRKTDGSLFSDGQALKVRFLIRQNNANGSVAHGEDQTLTVNKHGAISATIGIGNSIPNMPYGLNAVLWGEYLHFLSVSVDLNGNNSFEANENFGSTQLLSVPYALYAKESGSSLPGPDGPPGPKGDKGDKGDIGPQGPPASYSAGSGISISNNTVSNTGDLSSTNELQTLAINNHQLSISNGNSVILPTGIEGNGSVGNLPKFTSNTTLGNSIIEESNGKIGIGGAVTGHTFTVHGGARITSAYITTSLNVDDVLYIGASSISQEGAALKTVGVKPIQDNLHDLGTSAHRWNEVWAADGTINTSDTRLKRDIQDISYGLKDLLQLRPVSYYWKDGQEGDHRRMGFIAQELQGILPEVVRDREWVLTDLEKGTGEWKPTQRLGVAYAEIIPVAVSAIQDQQQIIEEQAKRIESLEAKNKQFEKRFQALETALNNGK